MIKMKDSQSIDKSLMCFLQRTWDHCSHLGRFHAFDTCYTEGKIALQLSEVMVTESLGRRVYGVCFHEMFGHCSENLLFLVAEARLFC